jgi:hypothetical protein
MSHTMYYCRECARSGAEVFSDLMTMVLPGVALSALAAGISLAVLLNGDLGRVLSLMGSP